ncbi:Putative disease resistance protein RGA3 [Triticum urartu]|uniref:Putative disease resistance protein RGA3 n=1 Tax=Triticum urartu TaxID=4572 RepID=M7ZJP7_TRIUA|nr:Putative disease resistance protein RGA3 [Triticum urartu]
MSGLGGVIAGAVGKQMVSKLGGYAASEISLQWRYREDVLELEERIKDAEAVLGDADDKSRREGRQGGRVYERWLTKFKRVAYQVEDVLDELDANELISNTGSKVSLWFSRNNQLLQRIIMPHKIKDVTKKIDEIEKEGRRRLNLVPQAARAEGNINNSTFAANWNGDGMKTGMVGRGIEKEKIISLLLTSEEANQDISIIPVVGLGGIGKTTLVESVLVDKRLNVFDVSAWVNVSKQFDLERIERVILEKELADRRYLIVLDDLWEENGDKLESLKRMLQHGRKGSRIIVTTRNLSVVQKLRTGYLANERKICPVHEFEVINLDVLKPNDCWELMKQRAFGPDDDCSHLEEIGKQIAGKCGGLPLVANALGQVLSEQPNMEAWKHIRDTKVDLDSRDQKEALESLMLSYYYMKLEFKMCFTYLAAFPKGFVMDSNRLIQQWNALGYINSRHDGQRCINYLLGMSFLQIPGSALVSSSPLQFKAPPELVMHDLVHELALIIVGDDFIDLDATKSTTWNGARYCRHAQLTNFKNDPEVFKYIPHKLRSLHFRDLGGLQLPKKAFSRSKYIRVLDLSGHSAEGQSSPSSVVLPSSIKQLKLIRYLDATGFRITSLPKYFHSLQKMETLILSSSLLKNLPDSICRLNKLCYLDLSGSSSLSKLPASLGELSQLFFLNLSGCSMLQDLPESICELTCLHHLDMSDCCALEKLPDKFGSLLKLSFLNLSSCSKLNELPASLGELSELFFLNLSRCSILPELPKSICVPSSANYLTILAFSVLEHLNLSGCHELEKLPIDFSHLLKIEFVDFSGCYKVSKLPDSFCQLDHLKYLDLSDCHNLEELPECIDRLFQLEYLNLTSCPKLRLLPNSLCNLHKLRRLYLSYCLRLRELPSSFGELNLQILHMNGLPFMVDCPDSIGDMTSLTQFVVDSATSDLLEKIPAIQKRLNLVSTVSHHVHEIESRGCSNIVDLVGLTCSELILVDLQNVRNPEDADRVKLHDNSDIRVLKLCWENEGGKSVLDRLVPPRTLEHFWLVGYGSKDFPDWMSNISSYLPFLSEVTLKGLEACDYLPPFGALPNLRKLSLENIPNIGKIGKEFYGEGGHCMKLRVLLLESMENLEEWWTTESSKESEEFLMPNVHYLEVMDCPKLKFLPYPPRSMNWVLNNSETVLPEVGFGNLLSSICPSDMVLRSCSFSQDKWDKLQHFPTLEKFRVDSVSGLRTLPEVMQCFTSLTKLILLSLSDLEILPGWLGQLTSLEEIVIGDCANLTSLPESMENLTALKKLALLECKGLETLPKWLGNLTSLKVILIDNCHDQTSFPSLFSQANIAQPPLHLCSCSWWRGVLPAAAEEGTSRCALVIAHLSLHRCSGLSESHTRSVSQCERNKAELKEAANSKEQFLSDQAPAGVLEEHIYFDGGRALK